jgi:hypothetical protein
LRVSLQNGSVGLGGGGGGLGFDTRYGFHGLLNIGEGGCIYENKYRTVPTVYDQELPVPQYRYIRVPINYRPKTDTKRTNI